MATAPPILSQSCKSRLKSVRRVSIGWSLLLESGYCGDREVLERCVEVKKLLVSSINTAKEKGK